MQVKDAQTDPGESVTFYSSKSLGNQVKTASYYGDDAKWHTGTCSTANHPGIIEQYQNTKGGGEIEFFSDYVLYCFNEDGN